VKEEGGGEEGREREKGREVVVAASKHLNVIGVPRRPLGSLRNVTCQRQWRLRDQPRGIWPAIVSMAWRVGGNISIGWRYRRSICLCLVKTMTVCGGISSNLCVTAVAIPARCCQ